MFWLFIHTQIQFRLEKTDLAESVDTNTTKATAEAEEPTDKHFVLMEINEPLKQIGSCTTEETVGLSANDVIYVILSPCCKINGFLFIQAWFTGRLT